MNINAEYLESISAKNYDLEKVSKYLKNVIQDKEDYEIDLKKMILNMKEKSAVYIPIKEDTIDKKLADYINSYRDPNKLKVMFLREGEGVYKFGSKRIYIKI